MTKKNSKIDSYIKNAQPFARPILKKLRAQIHKGCPQVSEDIKWGGPFYLYKGRILCATMAFKKHCALIFWKSALIKKEKGSVAKDQLKHLRRISSLEELPSDRELLSYIKLAMHLNEPTTKLPSREMRSTPLKVPNDLMSSLRANPKALATFKNFTPSRKKDYVFWINGAKTDETRERRIEIATDWMTQGKPRNWKYEEKKKKKR